MTGLWTPLAVELFLSGTRPPALGSSPQRCRVCGAVLDWTYGPTGPHQLCLSDHLPTPRQEDPA